MKTILTVLVVLFLANCGGANSSSTTTSCEQIVNSDNQSEREYDSASRKNKIEMKVEAVSDGILFYLYNWGLPLKINKRMAWCPAADKSPLPECLGELSYELKDDSGKSMDLGKYYIRMSPNVDDREIIVMNRGDIVGRKFNYCDFVASPASLKKGRKYSIRAGYRDSSGKIDIFKGSLVSEWIDFTIPLELECVEVGKNLFVPKNTK